MGAFFVYRFQGCILEKLANNYQSVLVADSNEKRRHVLLESLEVSRYRVTSNLFLPEDLFAHVESIKPDIIFIGSDFPDQEVMDFISSVTQHRPCPIVLFAQDDDPRTIQVATQVGVSAYVSGDLSTKNVQTITEAAIARFCQLQNLKSELEKVQTNLSERKVIEQAKGFLINQKGYSEKEAHRALQKIAMNKMRRLAEVARDVVSSYKSKGLKKNDHKIEGLNSGQRIITCI